MGRLITKCVQRVKELMTGPGGLACWIAETSQRMGVDLALLDATKVMAHQVPADLVERSRGVQYPVAYIYCDKLSNTFREKFRSLSGIAQIVIEVRVSGEYMEEVQRQAELYAEAVAEVLTTHRGDWGDGMFYGGGYEISFGPIKPGGKHFLKTAKVTFQVDISAQ